MKRKNTRSNHNQYLGEEGHLIINSRCHHILLEIKSNLTHKGSFEIIKRKYSQAVKNFNKDQIQF